MNYEIVQDSDPISPRQNECFGTIVYTSSRYLLGDVKVTSSDIEDIMNDEDNIYLPVYAYIHGGVALNTNGFSCSWDSGQTGCIYVSKDKARQYFGVKRITNKIMEKILSALKAEVDEFSKYLNGEVYGYIIRDDDGNEIDSCFGFFGEDLAKAEAESALNFFAKKAS